MPIVMHSLIFVVGRLVLDGEVRIPNRRALYKGHNVIQSRHGSHGAGSSAHQGRLIG